MTHRARSAAGTRPGTQRYHERLWPGPLGWFLVLGLGTFVLVALLPVDTAVAAAAGALAVVVGVVVALGTSAVVAVTGGDLVAGRARIPVSVLGPARVLDRAGIRTALGPGSDARAYACLRSWIPTAVEVQVSDPQDPTPTWLVSTRRPSALVAALDGARDGPQAAHSEQIG